jgi:hypothetical protein
VVGCRAAGNRISPQLKSQPTALMASADMVDRTVVRIRRSDYGRSAGELAAALAFLTVFPTFILYQTLVRAGLMYPILGGYFTAGVVLALPLALYAQLRQRRRSGPAPTVVEPLFLAFLLLFSMSAVLGMIKGSSDEITLPHLAYVLKFAVIYLICKCVNGDSRAFQVLSRASLVVIIVAIAATASASQVLLGAVAGLGEDSVEIDYQGVALAYVVVVLFVAPAMSGSGRAVTYLASIPVLFLVGARSEFVAFVVLACAVEYCQSRSRMKLLLTLALIAVMLAAVWLIATSLLPENRMLGLLQLAADDSAGDRRWMHSRAVETIMANPIFGDYASYEPGTYAHNILAVWVDMGVFGFVLTVSLVLIPLVELARRFRRDSSDTLYVQAVSSMVVVTILLFLAKTHTYQLIPVAVGLYSRYRLKAGGRLVVRDGWRDARALVRQLSRAVGGTRAQV